jgi:uncharacterized protein
VSQENVQIVRELLDAFARGDHEIAFGYYDPEIEWDATDSHLVPDLAGMYRGHEGVRAYWRQWLTAWKGIRFEIADLVDAGDQVVAMIENQHQTGRHSGIETEMPAYALVFTLRDGKVVRWKQYLDPAAALEAVGRS